MMYKCSFSYCILWSYMYDGKWDCPEGDDEIKATQDTMFCHNMYKCKNTNIICIHLGNLCDKFIHCPHGDDELFCNLNLVICPRQCSCLMYGIKCIGNISKNFTVKYPRIYISVYFSSLTKVNTINLIANFINALIIKIPKNNIVYACTFPKLSFCLYLDLGYNLVQHISDKCFISFSLTRTLLLNNNKINFIHKNSFYNLSKLNVLIVSNNLLLFLPNFFTKNTQKIKLVNILHVTLERIKSNAFKDLNFIVILTNLYNICCIAPQHSVCHAFKPWYISCSDILPNMIMKILFGVVSSLIIILNCLSIITHAITFKASHVFSIIVIALNMNDILCGVYLCFILIADLSMKGIFSTKEEWWRSGLLCLTAFTIILWFTILTQFLLVTFSFCRLMVVIHPLKTKFKQSKYVLIILFAFIVVSLSMSVVISVSFRYVHKHLTTSFCLPFIDPTGKVTIIKIITWFVVISQFITSLFIVIMHCALILKLRSFKENIKNFKLKVNSEIPLIIQLITITVSNICCWFPANGIYFAAMFLSTYPINLIIWTTVIGLPLNSVINPVVFFVTTFKKVHHF